MKPYDWQVKDIEELARNDFTGLLNIQPGGTKTAISIWTAMKGGADQVLVIAPLNTHRKTWEKAVRELVGKELKKIGNGTKAERLAKTEFELGLPGWYVITPQLFTRSDISAWYPDLVIVDEVHNLNAPKKAGQKKLEAVAQQTGARLALSGTPARRSFERNWSNMRFLWPDLKRRGEIAHSNYYIWLEDRMEKEIIYTSQRDRFGKPKTANKWLRESSPGLLLKEAPCVIQHFRRDACCAFHPEGFLPLDKPQVIEREVPLSPAQKKAIKELEKAYITWLEDNPLVVDLALTQQQRIRQICLGVPTITYQETEEGLVPELDFEGNCESPFAEEVLEILNNLEDDEPVIIYMESQKFARVMVQKLQKAGYSAAEYSGVTAKNRDDYLARFGGDIQVIVGTITSIGTGTDGIQHVCNTEIWMERSVDDTANEQTEARADRIGAKDQVQRYILVDDMGYASGRMSEQLEKRLQMNKSMRRAVK